MADVDSLLPSIKKLLVERLFLDVAPETIGDDEDILQRFAIDSVRIFEVVVGLEESFGVSFADQDFAIARFSTPRKIAEVVSARQQ